jgi:hypothetical protein
VSDKPNFEAPDTSRALRAGLISGLIGLVVIVLVTVSVGRAHINTDAVIGIIERAQLLPLAGSMLVMSAAFLFLGKRWATLFPAPHKPPGRGLAAILCAGLLLNSALPGPVGEFGAAWFAHKRYRVPLGMSLAAGMGSRIIGMIMAALAALACWIWARPEVPAEYATPIEAAAFIVGLMGFGLLIVLIRPEWMARISEITIGRFERFAAAHRTVDEAADALSAIRSAGFSAILQCIAWSAIAHSCVLAGIAMAAFSLGSDPSMTGLLFTYATTTAAVIVMFALPGSQVGWDAIFLALLTTTAGLSMPDALAIAVVVRVQQLSIMAAGAAALTWLARTEAP